VAAIVCILGLLQPLRAQSAADEKCEGSTVDIQGPKTAQAARAFLAELQAAVQANDKDKIAGMISYPLNFIHDGKRARIRDKQTFLARYDAIFNEHVRDAIQKQSAHCLFGNANGEMIGRGEVWFSEMGDGSVKIITVNPSAGM
jgi:AICAR transformylase/IMP cyclohydrolase PurH